MKQLINIKQKFPNNWFYILSGNKEADKIIKNIKALGLKYDFTKNVGARMEWQRYSNIGNDSTTGQGDVNLYSIGIVFKF